MPKENGKQSGMDIAHRIGIWAAVLSIGAWVGAADEKFNDAETVEATQKQLVLDVNTLTTETKYTKEAVKANTDAIEASERAILAAIKAAHDDE